MNGRLRGNSEYIVVHAVHTESYVAVTKFTLLARLRGEMLN